MLSAVQRRARNLGLEIRFRRARDSGRTWLRFDVSVDGPLVRMETLFEQLALELPAFAEGARSKVPPRDRVAAAWDVIEAYFVGMKDIRASIFGLWEALGLGDYGAAPLSYVFDPGAATHLAGRLRGLTRTLGMFRAGYLPPEQAVEELHTATESLLREAVGKAGSFPDKVERAHAAGYLTHEMYEDVLAMNKLRVKAKHHGQSIPADVAMGVVNAVARACQALLLALLDREREAERSE